MALVLVIVEVAALGEYSLWSLYNWMLARISVSQPGPLVCVVCPVQDCTYKHFALGRNSTGLNPRGPQDL